MHAVGGNATDSGAAYRSAYTPQALSGVLFRGFGLRRNTRFIVAYSGGCDSQVLLHSLTEAVHGTACEVVAAHFNHQLQPEADDWVELCRNWAQSLGVDFASGRPPADELPPGTESNHRDARQEQPAADHPVVPAGRKNVEAWARQVRYQWLSGIAHEDDVVLTAHHANDQAETFLMNLFQGRGMAQLAGISPCREIVFGATTRLVRPLLGFTRDQLHEYARQFGLSWIRDPSNDSISGYRNRLRHELIPVLCRRSPDLIARLNNAANHCRKIAEREIDMSARQYRHSADPDARRIFCLADPLRVHSLTDLDEAACSALIRYWLHKSGCASPTGRQLSEFYRQLCCNAGQPQLPLGQQVMRRYNGYLYLTRAFTAAPPDPINWDLRGLEIGQYNIRVQAEIGLNQGLSRARIEGARLQWVWRRGGERMQLPHRTHSTALKKLLQCKRIPPWERDNLPMLTVDGEIAWVAGVGVSARFAAVAGEEAICPYFSLTGD